MTFSWSLTFHNSFQVAGRLILLTRRLATDYLLRMFHYNKNFTLTAEEEEKNEIILWNNQLPDNEINLRNYFVPTETKWNCLEFYFLISFESAKPRELSLQISFHIPGILGHFALYKKEITPGKDGKETKTKIQKLYLFSHRWRTFVLQEVLQVSVEPASKSLRFFRRKRCKAVGHANPVEGATKVFKKFMAQYFI